MIKASLRSILFDFDGVLSKGRFYSTIPEKNYKIKDAINKNVFNKGSWNLMQTWMRGEKSFEEIHKSIAEKVGSNVEFLNKHLIDSVLRMQLNKGLIKFAIQMRSLGVRTAIFTDNMDIFDRVFVPYHSLNEKFDFIFSSSTYKKLKLDNDAFFLKETIKKMKSSPSETLLLDDSPEIGVYMNKIGGYFYHYQDYEKELPKFFKWFKENFAKYGTNLR